MKLPYCSLLSPCLPILFTCFLFSAQAQRNELTTIKLLPGEKIWSGAIKEGHKMPFTAPYRFNYYANNNYNQLQPLLLSNKGLYVWSEEPFEFEIGDGQLRVKGETDMVKSGRYGKTLADARGFAAQKFFPASGKMPDELLFSQPQYNTWIELTYNQNQEDVLKYAKGIIDNGFPPGVLMIDDTWQTAYGIWRFNPARFPDPKKMIDELHKMGFKVMLWICPFISPDQYMLWKPLNDQQALLSAGKQENGKWTRTQSPAMVTWWNGASAELDFTHPAAVSWFDSQLQTLVNEYGVDGFKFDAGDMDFYPASAIGAKDASPNRHSELYAMFGLKYPLNEYRACWKMAGQPLAQRLHDKSHNWEDLGLLIPHMTTEGLVGYTFSCPDLVGGGEFNSFLNLSTIDQELVVRSAQCHALMPMMQFSVAPWRILDSTYLAAVKGAIQLRERYKSEILKLAKASAKDGRPIVSNMEYYFPNQNLQQVNDQFMLGDRILVAPMVKKGTQRQVALPKGIWTADDGTKYKGARTVSINVPLSRIPYFIKD